MSDPIYAVADYFTHNIPNWIHILEYLNRTFENDLNCLEVGAGEGRSAIYILDNFVGAAKLTVIDQFKSNPVKTRYLRNINSHPKSNQVKTLIGLSFIELAKLYGIAGTKNDSIIDFYEKPNEPKSTLAATAYWLLSESGITNFFNYINSGGDRDALGNFLAWNIQEADVKSVSFRGVWYDIGDLESYNTAQKWLSN